MRHHIGVEIGISKLIGCRVVCEAGYTLVDLISVATLIGWMAIPVATARQARAGFAGYCVAIAIGLLMGGCCVLAVFKIGQVVVAKTSNSNQVVKNAAMVALYCLALAAMILAIPVGRLVTGRILR
jgi:hypothetical protein